MRLTRKMGGSRYCQQRPERASDFEGVFDPVRQDLALALERFDSRQLTAIAEFLETSTELIYRHVSRLRGESATPLRPETRQPARRGAVRR